MKLSLDYCKINILIPGLTTPEQELLARYFLSRILDTGDAHDDDTDGGGPKVGQRRQDQDPAPSIVYPQVSQQVRIAINSM